jgi:hypothetical protein
MLEDSLAHSATLERMQDEYRWIRKDCGSSDGSRDEVSVMIYVFFTCQNLMKKTHTRSGDSGIRTQYLSAADWRSKRLASVPQCLPTPLKNLNVTEDFVSMLSWSLNLT